MYKFYHIYNHSNIFDLKKLNLNRFSDEIYILNHLCLFIKIAY